MGIHQNPSPGSYLFQLAAAGFLAAPTPSDDTGTRSRPRCGRCSIASRLPLTMATGWQPESSSFRDPNGFVFHHEGAVYRQINSSGHEDYRRLVDSGLYTELAGEGLLVSHEEVELRSLARLLPRQSSGPNVFPFISYPYEWCFGQLKAAALLTLAVQKRALARDLILRDASAFNVQFVGSRPIFIDTLSFGSGKTGSRRRVPAVLPAFPGTARVVRVGPSRAPRTQSRSHRRRSARRRSRHCSRNDVAATGARHSPAPARPQPPGRWSRQRQQAFPGTAEDDQDGSARFDREPERTIDGLKWNPPPTLWSAYTGSTITRLERRMPNGRSSPDSWNASPRRRTSRSFGTSVPTLATTAASRQRTLATS